MMAQSSGKLQKDDVSTNLCNEHSKPLRTTKETPKAAQKEREQSTAVCPEVTQEKAKLPRGYNRRRRRREKKSSNCSTETKHVSQGILFVEFPKRYHVVDLTSHLLERMGRKTKIISSEILSTAEYSSTVVKLTFPSNKCAKSASQALKQSNYMKNKVQIKCVFSEVHLTRSKSTLETSTKQNEVLSKVRGTLESNIAKQLDRHEKKIKKIQKSLESLQVKKHVKLEEYERINGERETLKSKLTELKLQKEEFVSCVEKSVMDKLNLADRSKNFNNTVNQIRLRLGREMARLENAFPIYARRKEIVDTVANNSVCVVLGETGSGKSTQLPQFLYESEIPSGGIIVCTQPRKIAATSLATHVASELLSNVGQIVGYRVGMKSKTSSVTKIVYMTDHVLLNEILTDPTLSKISCVVVDEAHERSIFTDLLLGMLKQCMSARPDLKVIITSATIDPELFVRYFGGCPVVKVSGRTFPVEVIWQSPETCVPFENHVTAAVEMAARVHEIEQKPGDILVFLTSPFETERSCSLFNSMLQGRNDFKCMQIHGKLQAEEQQAVFEPLQPQLRKIVFATNSAETSVTIPGIKYVIDTGLVKEMQYDPKKGLSSLDTVIISQSSAEQRKGRAGRMSTGKCFRLYAEEDYYKMKTSSLPEILRVHLGQALLKLLDLGVDPSAFDFVESPPDISISKAMDMLNFLGANDENGITKLGKDLALMPFEPRLGKLILSGHKQGIAYEAITLAALTTMGSSIFYRGGDSSEKMQADLRKTRFCLSDGDHLTFLNVYQEWFSVAEKKKNQWCVENSINARIMRQARELANEVLGILRKQLKMDIKLSLQTSSKSRSILKNILFEASQRNLAVYLGHPKAGYLVPGQNQIAHIHPSSSVNAIGGKPPEWVVFEQLINTSRDYLTSITPVEEDLVRQTFSEGKLNFDLNQISNLKVTPLLTRGLGQRSFQEFVGTRFSSIRVVEEDLKVKSESRIVCVEANRERLEIAVHVSENVATKCRQVFDENLLPVMQKMKSAQREIPISGDNDRVRAVLVAGGMVSAILFSWEYRTIYLDEVPATTEEYTVAEWLNQYGSIIELKRFNRRGQTERQRWGTVTFETAVQAKAAVDGLKCAQFAKGTPCISRGPAGQPNEFTLKLTWQRRPLKGFGFITTTHPEDMVRLSGRHLYIDGYDLWFRLNRKDGSNLYVSGLPHIATELKIQNVIENYLGKGTVQKVALVREKAFTTTSLVHGSLKQRLEAQVWSRYSTRKLSVTFPMPTDQAVNYTAYLRFSDPVEGLQVFNAISNSIILDANQVHVQQDLKNDIFIPKYMTAVLLVELEALEKQFQELSISNNMFIKRTKSKAGHTYIKIQSEDPESLVTVKRAYDSLLAGETLDLSEYGPVLRYLFGKEGKRILEVIEKSTHTIIRSCNYQVVVIGGPENRTQAIVKIKDHLNLLVSQPIMSVSLGNEVGLMKKVLGTYGIDLKKLKENSGIQSVELDYRNQKLTLKGSQESLKKASQLINDCRNGLSAMTKTAESEQISILCVVCFSPIDDGQLRRLNVCGHPYCVDCMVLQFQSSVDNRDFPLLCAGEGCGEMWCWADIDGVLCTGEKTIGHLVTSAVDIFVAQNQDKYHFCLTPNCPGVFPLSSEGTLFVCSSCQARICSSCKVQYHDGITCAMYQSEKSDPGLSEWMAKDRQNNKKCPKCTTAIQKNGGCNHVTCGGCKIHICWVCMKIFQTDQQCYGHLQTAHGSFV